MRALIQRVASANVTVEGAVIGEIGEGVLVFVCAMANDPSDAPERLATKISNLRIFRDDEGRMNRSLGDIDGHALVVSQFTLAADTRRGNRPGFSAAASPEVGARSYEMFVSAMMAKGFPVETGRFGADMKVSLVNDGPVTIWLDTET